MNTIAIAVHGGAKPYSPKIDEHRTDYEKGIHEAISAGYEILIQGGSSLDAVHNAVRMLEDNIYFNAGRGSALNNKGEVEMDASIMDGSSLAAGAVAIVTHVKNPISLARAIMENTSHVFLGGQGALRYAETLGMELQDQSYFVSSEQYDALENARLNKEASHQVKVHGTVGAVAVDVHGNVAAATSTGGTTNQMEGRIGDSCMIGAGCYANNKTCAISATGDGEYIIRGNIGHAISSAIQYRTKNLQEACDYVIHEVNKNIAGDIGIIAVDPGGNVAISFNSRCMIRGWRVGNDKAHVQIYK